MAWSLKGSYFETCSCDLMCPCNFSFDHGATYDYCRVTLVFDIRDGEIEGTDVSGLKLAVDRRHAQGDDRGELAARDVRRRGRLGRADGEAHGRVRRPAGWADGRSRAARRRGARCRAGTDRSRRGRVSSTASASATRSTSRSRTSSRSASRPASRCGSSVCSIPVGSELTAAEATRSRISAFGIEYEGKTGLSTPSSPGRPSRVIAAAHEEPGGRGGLAPAFAADARETRARRAALRARRARLVVDGRADAGHGRRALDRARDARAGSSAYGS